MFKNVLVPTDGSSLSLKAAAQGVALAKALDAKVTGFFAAPPATPVVYRNNLPVGFAQPGEHEKMIEEDGGEASRRDRAAREEGGRAVRRRARHQRLSRRRHSRRRQKEKVRCHRDGDARRRRLRGMFIGSVTQKVLNQSKIPVLVLR